MQFKKSKTFLAAILAAAMTCSALLPTAASAAGTRTKAEKYGDSTYAERFMSLYDDVITNGVSNGYMSQSATVDGGFNVPYHSVEELCIEAPDYGHETTSEALSYLVWVAAMRDNIVNKGTVSAAAGETVGDTAKAWKTLESALIPDVQGSDYKNYMAYTDAPKATYSAEWDNTEDYPTGTHGDKNGYNPIHKYFTSAYGSTDKGLYLLHWLADVDNWYGYYDSSYKQKNVGGSFTMINTFQRGASESCWETLPHASVETLKYGISGRGMKGFFNTEERPAQQWCYTNAPDAEDRAIQAVYAANRWGVGNQTVNSKWGGNTSLSALAGKMGDELRNDMYDKYYQKIGGGSNILNSWSNNADETAGKHYLMSWYTSWGGAMDCSWAWQIGCSHSHEFYQNPLAAFALLADSDLKSGMKSQGAEADYVKSLQTQMELYLWLLSSDGLIAGGCTNSLSGHYGADTNNLPTFNGMYYQEHPVYADPGSNHWIGNQVWAVQRLAELYYVIKTSDDAGVKQVAANCKPGGMTLEAALETILNKWVSWFVDNTILGTASKEITWTEQNYDGKPMDCTIPDISTVTDDGKSYAIPSIVNWSGKPNTWSGSYQENATLTAKICGYGSSDMGCVSSLANSLIYYAAANKVDSKAATDAAGYQSRTAGETDSSKLGAQALYLAKELLDREWDANRDDIGLSATETNGSLKRLWEQEVYVPTANSVNGEGVTLSSLGLSNWEGTMPNGDKIKNGVKFIDIRTQYEKSSMYQDAKAYYDANGNTDGWEFNLHRFWHAGDILMALGTMSEVYPDVTPEPNDEKEDDLVVTPTEITVEVGETADITSNVPNSDFKSDDDTIATVDKNGTVTGVKEGTTTITVTTPGGQTSTVTVTVTPKTSDTTTTAATTTASGTTTTGKVGDALIGDTNLDGAVSLADLITFQKQQRGAVEFNDQQTINADCDQTDDEGITPSDVTTLLEFLIGKINTLPKK